MNVCLLSDTEFDAPELFPLMGAMGVFNGKVIVHPECHEEVVNRADLVGSTEFIIKTVQAAPGGTTWAVGTELNLVNRLKREQSDKRVFFLSNPL